MCEGLREPYAEDYLSLFDDQLTLSFLNDNIDISLEFFNDLKYLPDYEPLKLDSVCDLEKNDSSASLSSYFDNLNKTNDRNSKIDWVTKSNNFSNNYDNKITNKK